MVVTWQLDARTFRDALMKKGKIQLDYPPTDPFSGGSDPRDRDSDCSWSEEFVRGFHPSRSIRVPSSSATSFDDFETRF